MIDSGRMSKHLSSPSTHLESEWPKVDQLKSMDYFLAREPNESSGANYSFSLYIIWVDWSYIWIGVSFEKPELAIYGHTTKQSLHIQPTRNLCSQVNIRCFFSMGDVIRFSCKGRLQSMSIYIYAMDCYGMWIMDDKKLESTDCDGMG